MTNFTEFKNLVDEKIHAHQAIANNQYTKWFAQNARSHEDVKDLVKQLAVFSNDLNIALLHRLINAQTRESMRKTKEILMNELGVIYKPKNKVDYNPEDVGNLGSVDGGKFRFKAAHYEWLADTGEAVGLAFNEFGKTQQGNQESQEFSRIMIEVYKSLNPSESDGANYALEHWASSGFWVDLIAGFKKLEEKTQKKIPIGYFTFHYEIEAQHTSHTEDDLVEVFNADNFNEKNFISGATKILDALNLFWSGLHRSALARNLY
jgi:pyrroloquinoline quinone (PQQ) biosynthesis protein C